MKLGIMHMVATLDSGGAERVAVNMVNHLPRERYHAHLCTTRRDGPLAGLVAGDVGRLRLTRRLPLDPKAVWQLVGYVRRHDIRLIHAHSTSLYMAFLASLFPPYPVVVWHDHYGKCAVGQRPTWQYRLPTSRAGGVIAVNQMLADWSRHKLHVRADRAWYIPNFVAIPEPAKELPSLPGKAGSRIVCVANLRPQKDHLGLVRAMSIVAREAPDAHLLLVGGHPDPAHLETVRAEISRHGLEENISLLGQRQDVSAILQTCDIGVLGSESEAFPLSLIEYGMAGLAAVATEVGQCREVLDEGRAGVLVPASAPDSLAEALLSLLKAPDLRKQLGDRFRQRALALYSAGPVIEQICRVYDTVMPQEISGQWSVVSGQ